MSKEFITILRCNTACILDNFDELRCQICNQLMINPSHTPCCCEFCYQCVTEHINSGKDKCPGSSEDCLIKSITINDVKLSPVIENRISKLKVKCPNKKCNEEDKMSKIIQHASICDKLGLRCPLRQNEYEFEVEDENELKNHKMEQREEHLSNSLQIIEELKNRVSQSEVDIIRKLETEKKLPQNKIITLLENEKEDSKNEIAGLKLKDEKFMDKNKERVEMRIKLCPLIWIVENWSQKFDNKSSVDKLVGPTFYSKSCEYKWRVGIIFDINCVRFFGQILQGEFDDGLEWPCKKYIRLEIMDQFSEDIFKQIDISFGNNGIRRPTKGDNQIKFGDNSISFSDFDIPSVFVQNNKMFFRISCPNY